MTGSKGTVERTENKSLSPSRSEVAFENAAEAEHAFVRLLGLIKKLLDQIRKILSKLRTHLGVVGEKNPLKLISAELVGCLFSHLPESPREVEIRLAISAVSRVKRSVCSSCSFGSCRRLRSGPRPRSGTAYPPKWVGLELIVMLLYQVMPIEP